MPGEACSDRVCRLRRLLTARTLSSWALRPLNGLIRFSGRLAVIGPALSVGGIWLYRQRSARATDRSVLPGRHSMPHTRSGLRTGTSGAQQGSVTRKIAILLAAIVLPGGFLVLFGLWFLRAVARTQHGRKVLDLARNRVPAWISSPLWASRQAA
jgi:hypothetical protein